MLRSHFIVRWWLTGILLILPFHFIFVKSLSLTYPVLANYINKFEEITLVVFLPLSIIELYLKGGNISCRYLALSIPFLVFIVSGYVSGLVAGNSLLITTHGVFHYIKYFLVIFIYAAYFTKIDDFKKIYRLLLMISIFLVVVALIQEIWAIVFRYILEKNIDDSSVYILCGAPTGGWRFGIYRAPSLIGHYNILGLYCLLIVTVYLSTVTKVRFPVVLSLFAGVFMSISRMIYLAALIITGIEIFRRRWIMFLFMIPLAVILLAMTAIPEFDQITSSGSRGIPSEEISSKTPIPTMDQFRISAREKAFEVWGDHPFLGVGPGMFGSEIAFKYRSPVYWEYNFYLALNLFETLDQFWPQVLAETGIIGTAAFAGILITIFITFVQYVTRVTADEVSGLFKGLMIFMICILIFSLGGILNHPPIFYSYSALVGMALGSVETEEKHIENLM